jgi:hypothetical protein
MDELRLEGNHGFCPTASAEAAKSLLMPFEPL